jgi:hypothetical protein
MIAFRVDDLRQHSDILRLRTGKSVTVRFVEPRDAEALQVYVRSLTVSSRHNRFLGAISELPQSELDRIIRVGEANRFSVIAVMTLDGMETIVGEARYAFDADTDSFEFGLSVDDRWQGHGWRLARCSAIWNAARRRSAPSGCSGIRCAPTTP